MTVNRQPSTVNDRKECLYNLGAHQLMADMVGHSKCARSNIDLIGKKIF
jgi:hypothetical protein